MKIYKADAEGRPTGKLMVSRENYDPRIRPWYTAPVKAGRPAWSDINDFVSKPVDMDQLLNRVQKYLKLK